MNKSTQSAFLRISRTIGSCAGKDVQARSFATAASSPFLGEPTAALTAPGNCVFGPTEWSPATLKRRQHVSHDTQLLVFNLPDNKPLGLSTCACILASIPGLNGPDDNIAVRPYTPVSTNATKGAFHLLVKVYPNGLVSKRLGELKEGESVNFKHIDKNVKIQYPFGAAEVDMIVGGTGITPMIQALHALLGAAGDKTRIRLLYGSRTSQDIIAKEELEAWAKAHPCFEITHVLSHEPESSGYAGKRGFVDADIIKSTFSAPSPESLVFVCGPPAMYDAICGPRDQPDLTGVLADLGYSADRVVKF